MSSLNGHSRHFQNIAILGGGPAASTLAILLRRAGRGVVMFHRPKQTALTVGESLVPAIVTMLRRLGVEEEVRAFSLLKPGATFNITPEDQFAFWFERLPKKTPHYSYNTPRDRFDETILKAARKAGAHVVEAPAQVERVGNTDRVRLTGDSLAAWKQHFSGEPDLIVDATGRARVIPNLVGIPSRTGPRKDTALFAHVDKAKLDYEGHVHTTRMAHGWSWQIPLPGRVSVGLVVGTEFLAPFGATKEERYDNWLKQEPMLQRVTGQSKRITPVMEYTNYQLVSDRMVGDGWVLVGDTAGFVDPVFSSGLLIGMYSAMELCGAIESGTARAFANYEREVKHQLTTWQEIVDYFYNGRLFTFFRAGERLKHNIFIKLTRPHLVANLGGIFSGAASTSAYSTGLLRFLMKHALRNEDPAELAVR